MLKEIKILYLLLTAWVRRYSRRFASSVKNTKPNLKTNNLRKVGKRSILRLPLSQPKLVGAVLLVILLLSVPRYFSRVFASNVVTEGIVGVYQTGELPPTVTNLMSEGLVSIDPAGHPQPHLAVGWQVNNDSTVYTFRLRDNLVWSDGTKLKSSDIKINLQSIDESFPDDKTIQLQLKEPYSALPSLLTQPVFKEAGLVGLGRYKVAELQSIDNIVNKLTLEPSDSSSNMPDVVIKFYPDEKTAKIAYQMGEIQALIGITDDSDLATEGSTVSKSYSLFNKIVAIFYNTKDQVLGDKNLRKAASFATPKVENEDIAKTSIPPSSWAFNDSIKESIGNYETAKDYLAKVQTDKTYSIVLTTTPSLSSLGEDIVKAWKQVGIPGVLRVESGIPQNFQALLMAEPIPSDPDQYLLWHSTQSSNLTKYASPRVDRDLEDGRKSNDPDIRKQRYADMQKVLSDDAPATFLYFPKTEVVMRKKIQSKIDSILDIQFNNQ